MIEIINLIEEIQNLIFDFDIKTAMNKVGELIECLIIISSKLDQSKLDELMVVMNSMNVALANKDYLLFSDILQYKLKAYVKMNITEEME